MARDEKKEVYQISMRSAARSDKICPKRSALVDKIIKKQACAELEAERESVDPEHVTWRKPKKKKGDFV